MATYKIIEAKKATYYGIGMAMAPIRKEFLENEYSVLPYLHICRENMGKMEFISEFHVL